MDAVHTWSQSSLAAADAVGETFSRVCCMNFLVVQVLPLPVWPYIIAHGFWPSIVCRMHGSVVPAPMRMHFRSDWTGAS